MFSIAVHDNAWVLISDGRRTIFFVNQGEAKLFDRHVIETRIDKKPATRHQGFDASGL